MKEEIQYYKKSCQDLINSLEESDKLNLDKGIENYHLKDQKARLISLYNKIPASDNQETLQKDEKYYQSISENLQKNYEKFLLKHDIEERIKILPITNLHLASALILRKNNKDDMQKIDFSAKMLCADNLKSIINELNELQLEKNQKIEMNLMVYHLDHRGDISHFSPIIIRKNNNNKPQIFCTESLSYNPILTSFKNSYEKSNIHIIFPNKTIQKDYYSCFYYALSHLHILAKLSDTDLKEYFKNSKVKEKDLDEKGNRFYNTSFDDIARIPQIIKYTQSVSQLKNYPNSNAIQKSLQKNKKILIGHKEKSKYGVTISKSLFEYKFQNHSINYAKLAKIEKIEKFLEKNTLSDKEILEKVHLNNNNITIYIKSRIKPKDYYNQNKITINDLREQDGVEKLDIQYEPESKINFARTSLTLGASISTILLAATAITTIIFSALNKITQFEYYISVISASAASLFGLAVTAAPELALKIYDVTQTKNWNEENPDNQISTFSTFVNLTSKRDFNLSK
jgi:hypothetical protein